ncbi:MAG: adenylate/guanylate cyclase domain-containing protein [Verrucomicrobiae bacterium]|nr:adenylate/guanylate cyclase domain-containing protein [Verrucomicrobiae bacterium]
MQLTRPKAGPLLVALSVLALVCGVRLANPEFFERLERITYDARVRNAQKFSAPVATNLAFVAMQDSSIKAIRSGKLFGRSTGYGLYWPRFIYGRLVEELSAQGAREIAFDVLFGELRPDHPSVQMADGSTIESDDFFALQMAQAGNITLAFTPETIPADLFTTNAQALGDISTERDSDGVLRSVRCYSLKWHPVFKSAAHQLGVDLDHARIETGQIVLPLSEGTNLLTVKLDQNGNFDLEPFLGEHIPAPFKRFEKPFTRVWDLGIVMAAQELKLDLDHAKVDLPGGKIVLTGPNGLQRVLPVDDQGFFYINWQLTAEDPRLVRATIEEVLQQDNDRLHNQTNKLNDVFRGRLVVVGSTAQGNDLTDKGATPLEKDTFLVSKHWNVANSVITGRFIHRVSLPVELLIIILLAAVTCWVTWQLRAIGAILAVVLLLSGYTGLTFLLFVKFRWWLPLFYPMIGAVVMQYGTLATYRVMFEEREKRRVRSVFAKVVSPNVVSELLDTNIMALNGASREVTIFFADIRGFTSLTDQAQEQVADFVRHHEVDLVTADKYFEAAAREMLEMVNLYLAAVADVIKKHGGTLDKYIGDCVMAFWNAPTPNEKHALACVEAAIEAQRAIQALNERRQELNYERELENRARVAAGLPPRPLHVALHLGTGINTGLVTVGLMGSDQHILNYTVFGREVNLASRLEGESGSGRIIISDTTYNHLLRHSPATASKCVELFPVKPKGFLNPVRIYEVPWQEAKSTPFGSDPNQP